MIFRSSFYQGDLGGFFRFVGLSSDLKKEYVPQVLQDIWDESSLGLTKISIKPRRIVGLFQGKSFFLEYPFRPDTPEWYQFWQEILSNPLIAEVRGIGEKVNYV